ncbi:hypothetical protein V8C35DRAFT_205783 [Trichoderma chlorosporum]
MRQRRQLRARRDKLGREQAGELVSWQIPMQCRYKKSSSGGHGITTRVPLLSATGQLSSSRPWDMDQAPIPGAAQLVQDLEIDSTCTETCTCRCVPARATDGCYSSACCTGIRSTWRVGTLISRWLDALSSSDSPARQGIHAVTTDLLGLLVLCTASSEEIRSQLRCWRVPRHDGAAVGMRTLLATSLDTLYSDLTAAQPRSSRPSHGQDPSWHTPCSRCAVYSLCAG